MTREFRCPICVSFRLAIFWDALVRGVRCFCFACKHEWEER